MSFQEIPQQKTSSGYSWVLAGRSGSFQLLMALTYIIKLMSDTESAQSDIQDKKKRKSKKNEAKSKQKDAKGGKGKAKREPKKKKEGKQPEKKGAKSKEQQDKAPPRKASKSKGKKNEKTQKALDGEEARELALDYMTKQNRPYSLINIFDNLHAAVKKPVLEKILDGLVDQEKLSSKEYNKNKIYMLNQGQFNISNQEMEGLTMEMADLREGAKDIEEEVKAMQTQFKILTSKPRFDELVKQVEDANKEIQRLEHKMDVYGHDWKGVPQQEVEKIQKIYALNTKQAKKRQKIVKEALKTWAEILQKKIAETADIIGVDLI